MSCCSHGADCRVFATILPRPGARRSQLCFRPLRCKGAARMAKHPALVGGTPITQLETLMHRPVRTAIFPVGGLGVRFLPATKAVPKEMLPVVDKPLIQYAVEEAKAAGIEQFVFVTGRGKTAIEDHFDHSYELHATLVERHKKRELDLVADILPVAGQVAYVRQQVPLGLGHAVWCARHLAAGEPVAVLLADDLVKGEVPCLKQMVDAYARVGGNRCAVMGVPRARSD